MNSLAPIDFFIKEITAFKDILLNSGLHESLRFLNSRTPHRYTGVYRYENETLRNIAIFDKYDPFLQKGEDVPIETSYCSLLQTEQQLVFADVNEDYKVKGKVNTPVISYCGVLLETSDGKPFGSLCHFDMKRCEERVTDLPLLQEAGKIIYSHLLNNKLF